MKVPEGTPNVNLRVLDQILATTRQRLPAIRARRAEFEAAAAEIDPPPSFSAALLGEHVGVIAELKRRSPSAGEINAGLDPAGVALAYQRGGAAAISVLTEVHHFGGATADLVLVGRTVALPLLRKDFILDEIQLLEAKAAGAAAVLLIVRCLGGPSLDRLLGQVDRLGLEALVEVHDAPELARAVAAGARVIGVNARNLDDFSVDVDGSLELIAAVPPDRIAVAESGMSVVADVERAAKAGADAVLIGSALARAVDPESRTRELTGVSRHGR